MAKKIKKIPYGIADFELIRRYDYYYYSVPEVLHTLLTIYNPQVRHHNEPIFGKYSANHFCCYLNKLQEIIMSISNIIA
jgi:hypothetical protein